MIQIGFVLFVLFIVMEIGFFILILRLAIALINYFIKRRKAAGDKSKSGAVANALIGIFVLAISLIPAFLFTGYRELASHGYVVVRLDHPYYSFFTPDTDGILITVNPDFLQEAMRVSNDEVSEKETVELTHQ